MRLSIRSIPRISWLLCIFVYISLWRCSLKLLIFLHVLNLWMKADTWKDFGHSICSWYFTSSSSSSSSLLNISIGLGLLYSSAIVWGKISSLWPVLYPSASETISTILSHRFVDPPDLIPSDVFVNLRLQRFLLEVYRFWAKLSWRSYQAKDLPFCWGRACWCSLLTHS